VGSTINSGEDVGVGAMDSDGEDTSGEDVGVPVGAMVDSDDGDGNDTPSRCWSLTLSHRS
jgi:hypothetical protein